MRKLMCYHGVGTTTLKGGVKILKTLHRHSLSQGNLSQNPKGYSFILSSLRKMTARRFSTDFALQNRIAAKEDLNNQRLLADPADPTKKESSDKSITIKEELLFVNQR
jgi:hypothetical protein